MQCWVPGQKLTGCRAREAQRGISTEALAFVPGTGRVKQGEEQNLSKRIVALAIAICAVMVLVAGASFVMALDHHVVKGPQGPRASAVSWEYTPTENGGWYGHIVNSGLRSLVVDVDDVTSGTASSILHQRIRFAAYPTNLVDTETATMTAGHTYNITVTPNGPRGTFCDVTDVFERLDAPIARFTYTVDGPTVNVNGSTSSDPDGIVMAWGWDWDDGTVGTGKLASHTYSAAGVYTIVLTVVDDDGLTNSTSQDVTIVDDPPVAAFSTSVNVLTVTVDASASSDDRGIVSWSWDWGDQSPLGSGEIATHTYGGSGTYTITLTVTDTAGQTNSLSKQVKVEFTPPPGVSFTTVTASGGKLTVDASASTSPVGIASYDWDFGDMIIASGMTRVHTYIASGTYTVTLTVTDNIGQTASLSKEVAVENLVIPPLPCLYGMTFASDGSTPLPDCTISVTNVRTGETLIGMAGNLTMSDASGFYFVNDIMPLYVVSGDTVLVSAVGPAEQMGSSSFILDLGGLPYLEVNVTPV